MISSIAALALALPLAAQTTQDRVVTNRFPISSKTQPEIVVSIVHGAIRVTSHRGSEIMMTAKVHYEAEDAASLAELEKQVHLETEQSGNNVWIGVESEDWNRGSRWSQRPRELGWRGKTPSPSSSERRPRRRFRHDIELQVPRTTHLKLSTVNEGDIEVDAVAGEFHLNNVNGGIEVKSADGFGRAHTVNGPVSLEFQKNPAGPLSVKTINGKVHLYLLRGLNADFKIKTFNGKVYSDFELTGRPMTPSATFSEDGKKRVWRINRFSSTRAGKGGPEIEIDGFNGNVDIVEKK